MATAEISADEFVEYATFLYGDQWRNKLSAQLGVSRKSLVLTLASGGNITSEMTLSVIELVEQRLAEMQRRDGLLRARIKTLKNVAPNSPSSSTQPKAQYQRAC